MPKSASKSKITDQPHLWISTWKFLNTSKQNTIWDLKDNISYLDRIKFILWIQVWFNISKTVIFAKI